MRRFRTVLFVIALSNLIWALGFRLWEAIFTNFAREELGLGADQLGWVQSIREVPGLLGILVGVVALYVLEVRIAGVSVILMGVGIALTAWVGGLYSLIGVTLLMSAGFHFFYASNASAVLLTVGPEEAPRVLGRLNSLGAVASLLGTVVIVATLGTWGYRNLFLATGVLVVVVGLALLPLGRQERKGERRNRLPPLRKRYGLYYALQFLHGSRRHIFTTFAVFLMVSTYRVPAQVMALLYLVNYLLGTYLHQAFGQIVARHGERRVLTVNFCLLAVIFIGYALLPMIEGLQHPSWEVPAQAIAGWTLFPAFPATPVLLILMVLFVADNVLFGFAIALECYFQKIALGPAEITANVSMGQTMNHIAAVIIPVVGGAVWITLGPQYTFLAGVVIVLVALGLTQLMRVPPARAAPAEESCACETS
jgi:MFS family permease